MDVRLVANRMKTLNMNSILAKIIKELEPTIIDFNLDQLRAGFDSDGVQISYYHPYADLTVFWKSLDGTLTNNDPDIVNLKDTEAFYRGFELFDVDTGISITSKDSKTDKLKHNFANEIFGLTEKNFQDLKPWIEPLLKIEINKHLKGG